MAQEYGYIYTRDNDWNRLLQLIKMGITKSIIDRGSTYLTGEPIKGNFPLVIQIPLDEMLTLDYKLKVHFKKYR